MADPESLFSFEVVVESVENIVISSHTPAIAFRLLDFSTLVIRSEENGRPRENCNSIMPGSCSINSGKSCLFKINKETLYTSLQNTPLYVMLVDICEKTKLLASTTISLSHCFESVWQSIERNGLDIPAVNGNKGIFELYNFMGTPVARVRLSYRIFSLGGTISSHVNLSKSLGKSASKPSETTSEKYSSRQHERSTMDESLSTQNLTLKTEEHLANRRLNVETQTDFTDEKPPIKSYHRESRAAKSRNGKANVNINRPPPLYYNSESSFMESFIPVNSKTLFHDRNWLEKRCDAVNNEEVPVMQRECSRTVSVQTTNEEVSNCASMVPGKGAQLMDLPLINALINELSLARENRMNTAEPKSEHHDDNNTKVKPVNSHNFQPDTNSLRCGIKDKIHHSAKGKIQKKRTEVKPAHKGVLFVKNPVKFKKSLLKCGTTKTQKLREVFNKRTTSYMNDIVSSSKGKRPQNNVENRGQETKEISSGGDQKNNQLFTGQERDKNNLRYNRQGQVMKDVGIQVMSPDDNPLSKITSRRKDELSFSDEDNRNQFGVNSNDPSQIGACNDPSKIDLKSPEDQEDLSSPSKLPSTAQELVSIKPTFCNFPPPARKNSRYGRDKHSDDSVSEQGKSDSSEDSGLSKRSSLLGKTYNHAKGLSKTPNSSIEDNYSQDNFDSFASDNLSDKVAESNTKKKLTESNASSKGLGSNESNTSDNVVESNTSDNVVESNTSKRLTECNASSKGLGSNESNTSDNVVESNTSKRLTECNASSKGLGSNESNTSDNVVESNTSKKLTECNASSKGLGSNESNTSDNAVESNTSKRLTECNASSKGLGSNESNTSDNVVESNTSKRLTECNASSKGLGSYESNTSDNVVESNTSKRLTECNASSKGLGSYESNTSDNAVESNTSKRLTECNASSKGLGSNASDKVNESNASDNASNKVV